MEHDPDQPPSVETYRPLSKLAVGALLLSLLGLLSLLTNVLIVLPIVSLVVSVLALRKIAGGEVPLAGATAARLALAMSVFCVATFLGHYVLHRSLLIRGAHQHAAEFFDLLAEGRLFEAHQLMKEQGERQAEGADLDYYYRELSPEVLDAINPMVVDPYPLGSFREVFDKQPMKGVVEGLRSGQTPEYVRLLGTFYFDHYQVVNMIYRMPDGTEFVLSLRRDRDRYRHETSWRIMTLADVPEDERR